MHRTDLQKKATYELLKLDFVGSFVQFHLPSKTSHTRATPNQTEFGLGIIRVGIMLNKQSFKVVS